MCKFLTVATVYLALYIVKVGGNAPWVKLSRHLAFLFSSNIGNSTSFANHSHSSPFQSPSHLHPNKGEGTQNAFACATSPLSTTTNNTSSAAQRSALGIII